MRRTFGIARCVTARTWLVQTRFEHLKEVLRESRQLVTISVTKPRALYLRDCPIVVCSDDVAPLSENEYFTLIDDIVRHALHIRNKAGVGALAFGSDFDGISSKLEFCDYAGMPRLAAALAKYFTPREMDMICSGNALRVMREVWGK